MNKTAIKNFAIWARNKLIADITYKAGLLGITDKEFKSELPQSTKDVHFFDIGTKEPHSISGTEIKQREKLAEIISEKANQSDYKTAYKAVIEEVAYTWFNRLIAIRFMEVNDYLPSRIRVLSSESPNKVEPDLVTKPFETDLEFTPYEKDRIVQLTHENKLDELFRVLFIKQCNVINSILPKLFEKTSDYSELLLNVSFTDKDGVVYHLVHDIVEDDFNVAKEGQVEIIGWLYQYYNTEPKEEAFALLKKNVKITKERIPAATQLFTPDWIVRYMVENSLGRLWLEGHPNDALKTGWKYYLEEAEQEPDVQKQLEAIREEYKLIRPEEIKVIDPCMGSGHILVCAFDMLMQIYESAGYSQRDAAKSILENNLYGLDIDDRAFQLAYFAVMMKARQYNRRILNGETSCHVYAIQESNGINRGQLKYFGYDMSNIENKAAIHQMESLLNIFTDAKDFGSLLNISDFNWNLLFNFVDNVNKSGQMTMDAIGIENTKNKLYSMVETGFILSQRYNVVVTNPPYLSSSKMSAKLNNYLKKNYSFGKNDLFSSFIEKSMQLSKHQGFIAMITMHSWMFLSRYEELRKLVLSRCINNMAHFGAKAFEDIGGEVVQTVAFSLRNISISEFRGSYSRLVQFSNSDEKASNIHSNIYQTKQSKYQAMVDSIIAYWVSPKIYEIVEKEKRVGDVSDSRQGIATGNNDVFLRFWFEPAIFKINFNSVSQENMNESGLLYAPYNKGGSFRRWYGNRDYVIKLDSIHYAKLLTMGNHLPSRQYYYKPGITWNDVSTALFCARYVESGFVFADSGPTCFYNGNNMFMLAFLNSKVSQLFLNIICQGLHYSTGHIPNIPFIFAQEEEVTELAQENVALSKHDWDSRENSWDFKRHPLLGFVDAISPILIRGKEDVPEISKPSVLIKKAFTEWDKFAENQFVKLKENEKKLNHIFNTIYDLQGELTPEVKSEIVC